MNEIEALIVFINKKLLATVAIKRNHLEEKTAWKFYGNNVTVEESL